MRVITLCLLSVIVCRPVLGDYLESIPVFWRTLYPQGGVSLYCGEQFQAGDRRYNIEHVFPMAWVTRALRCGSRQQCRRRSARFNQIESDWHNLFPARSDLNQRRGAMAFGLLDGERWVEAGCDLEISERERRVEPRPAVRGDIARAMLYMADRYDLTLFRRQRKLLQQWHREDPPDDAERERNLLIRKVQNQGNPWIE